VNSVQDLAVEFDAIAVGPWTISESLRRRVIEPGLFRFFSEYRPTSRGYSWMGRRIFRWCWRRSGRWVATRPLIELVN